MPRPRVNWIELTLIVIGVAVVAFLIGRADSVRRVRQLQPFISRTSGLELGPLEKRFGPNRNTRHAEEWIIRDFFNDERDGVFVDVGANDYKRESNTYYLETQLGWSGVAIEPQAKFAADFAKYRPRTTFVPLFVSDTSNEKAMLFIPSDNDLIASTSKEFIAKEGGTNPTPIEVNMTTLDDVLTRAGIGRIDFLSIDVELHEPEVLRGFSIAKWQPRLVGIESHPEVRQTILDYFVTHGYTVVGKYLRMDTENLWFAPMGKTGK
jgi:FkbM family methyltransferase